jgi:hypothetical protein
LHWSIYVPVNNLALIPPRYTTDLPTIKTLLHVVPCKITWKGEVKLAEDKLWNQKLISDCSQKSSLAFCETAMLSIGNIHRIWTAVQNNIKDVHRGGDMVQVTMPKPYIKYKIISSSRSGDICYENFHYGKHENSKSHGKQEVDV